jgi:hypothetical protein
MSAWATAVSYEFTVEGGYYGTFSWDPDSGTSYGVVTGAEPAVKSVWAPDSSWTMSLFDADDSLVFDGGSVFYELGIWADRSYCDVLCFPHPTWQDSISFEGDAIGLVFTDSSGTLLPDNWALAPGDGPLPDIIAESLVLSNFDSARISGPISGNLTSWSLIQPIPEPNAAALFAVGGVVVVGTVRRGRNIRG